MNRPRRKHSSQGVAFDENIIKLMNKNLVRTRLVVHVTWSQHCSDRILNFFDLVLEAKHSFRILDETTMEMPLGLLCLFISLPLLQDILTIYFCFIIHAENISTIRIALFLLVKVPERSLKFSIFINLVPILKIQSIWSLYFYFWIK